MSRGYPLCPAKAEAGDSPAACATWSSDTASEAVPRSKNDCASLFNNQLPLKELSLHVTGGRKRTMFSCTMNSPKGSARTPSHAQRSRHLHAGKVYSTEPLRVADLAVALELSSEYITSP